MVPRCACPLVLLFVGLLNHRFGEDLDLLHDFGQPFTEEAGVKIVDGFTFDQQRTNTAHTLEGVVSLLEVRLKASVGWGMGGIVAAGRGYVSFCLPGLYPEVASSVAAPCPHRCLVRSAPATAEALLLCT